MFGDPDVNEDTALRLAKPSRRTASPSSDYYDEGRPITQEEVEREQREALLPTEAPYQPDPEDYFF